MSSLGPNYSKETYKDLMDSLCQDTAALAAIWQKRCAASLTGDAGGGGILLLLHSCDAVLETHGEQVQGAICELLRRCLPLRVLLSSRSWLPGPGCGQFKVVHQELRGLGAVDAARLFLRRAQRPLKWREILTGDSNRTTNLPFAAAVDMDARVVLEKDTEQQVLSLLAARPALAELKGSPGAIIELATRLGSVSDLSDLADMRLAGCTNRGEGRGGLKQADAQQANPMKNPEANSEAIWV